MSLPPFEAEPEQAPRVRVRLDVTLLRTHRDFRRLWTSGLVTGLGSMATYIALPLQMKQLTGSPALAGLLGAVEIVPLVVFGLLGGALADSVDRRRMAVFAELAMLGSVALLLLNAVSGLDAVWVLFVVAGLFAIFDSLQRPSLDALMPRLVPHDRLVQASALFSAQRTFAQVVGPLLGGGLAAGFGVGAAYGFDVVSFAVSAYVLSRLPCVRGAADGDGDAVSLRGIRAGLAYAWNRKELLGTYAIDTAAMVFAMVTVLFPFVADRLGASWALGALYAAESLGAFVATLTSGWVHRVHHHGRAIVLAAMTFGAAIAVFGLAGNIWLALGALAVAGFADMVSGIFRATVWNQTIPDELRGRLAGIELLSYSVGPVAGNARAGITASFTSQGFSIVSGGVLCVVSVAALAVSLPSLMRYDDRTNEHAVRERERRRSVTE